MGKKKKSILPKIEVLIILVFFASFIFWAASKCNATKLLYEEQESATSNVTEEATNDEKSEATQNTPISQEEAVPNPTKPNDISTTNQNTSISNRKRYSRLYVTIDGLNLRKEPSLKSPVITTFSLFEEIYFLDEITDFTEKINLGNVEADEPWVKVRGKKGHTGWVYGAFVSYYKKKKKGAF